MPDREHDPSAAGASGETGRGSPAEGAADGLAVVVWVADGTWQATVDAARTLVPAGARITLLHVAQDDMPQAGHGAYAGLLGRGRCGRDPGTRMAQLAASSAAELLDAAARRLAGPCTRLERHGRAEREVIATAEGADLLILGRDGDRSRLGPRSLGKATRFVLDHAPCQVLLVWPEAAPRTDSIPPPPPGHEPPGHEPPGHKPPGHEPPGHKPPRPRATGSRAAWPRAGRPQRTRSGAATPAAPTGRGATPPRPAPPRPARPPPITPSVESAAALQSVAVRVVVARERWEPPLYSWRGSLRRT
jgi:nucleotide-binding universal stress UspA family protein